MVLFRFEYDEAKSRANKAKHDIDFEQAQALWLDPHAVVAPARQSTELRFRVTGLIDGKLWSAIITYRDGRIRIISVRRARQEEASRYGNRADHR